LHDGDYLLQLNPDQRFLAAWHKAVMAAQGARAALTFKHGVNSFGDGGYSMKRFVCYAAGMALCMVASSVSASMVSQMWKCELNDDATEEAVMEAASEWAAEARKLPGGENMTLAIRFPVAGFEEWGKFWDAYPSSDVAQMERRTMNCPDSSLWEMEMVK
jgi:hypothetical protein